MKRYIINQTYVNKQGKVCRVSRDAIRKMVSKHHWNDEAIDSFLRFIQSECKEMRENYGEYLDESGIKSYASLALFITRKKIVNNLFNDKDNVDSLSDEDIIEAALCEWDNFLWMESVRNKKGKKSFFSIFIR